MYVLLLYGRTCRAEPGATHDGERRWWDYFRTLLFVLFACSALTWISISLVES